MEQISSVVSVERVFHVGDKIGSFPMVVLVGFDPRASSHLFGIAP